MNNNDLSNNLDFLDLLSIISFMVQMRNITNDENREKIAQEKEQIFYQKLSQIADEDNEIVKELIQIKQILQQINNKL